MNAAIPDARGECLRLASASLGLAMCTIFVQLPKKLKVGANFHLRLAVAAEQLVSKYPRAWVNVIPGPHRNYVLRSSGPPVRFILGTAKALAEFGFLNEASIFVADAEDQVLRLAFAGCPAVEGGAR
jgi:hypothetical protein